MPGVPQPSRRGAPKLTIVEGFSRSTPKAAAPSSCARIASSVEASREAGTTWIAPGIPARTRRHSSEAIRPGRRSRRASGTAAPFEERTAAATAATTSSAFADTASTPPFLRSIRAGPFSLRGWRARWWTANPVGQSAPWVTGFPFTPVIETGTAGVPTQRAFRAHPAGHSVQAEKRVVTSPRSASGAKRDRWVQIALSPRSFQGSGERARPAAEPVAAKRTSRRVNLWPISSSPTCGTRGSWSRAPASRGTGYSRSWSFPPRGGGRCGRCSVPRCRGCSR